MIGCRVADNPSQKHNQSVKRIQDKTENAVNSEDISILLIYVFKSNLNLPPPFPQQDECTTCGGLVSADNPSQKPNQSVKRLQN